MVFQWEREQWLSDCYEFAKHFADMEHEVEYISNGADPLDFHRHC